MKFLKKAISEGSFILDLKATDAESIFHQVINHVIAQGHVSAERRGDVEAALLKREQQVSTAIGNSVAVPHAYSDAFENPVVVFVRLAKPLNLGAMDGVPTRFLFFLLGSPEDTSLHLDTLAAVARLMSDDEFRYEAALAADQEQLLAALERFRQRAAPPAEDQPHEISPALQYTGKFCGGLLADLRRRLPHYVSDFRDGLSTKSLSSTLFLYFACLAPAVTFGGFMAIETGGQIGAVEMILASAICGVIYALFSGSPLIILGGTGPLLIFTVILYQLCQSMEIPFLATRAWVGAWTGLLLVILAVTDASFLMRFFTRFTDEIFAALISIIFIIAALESLLHIFTDHEVSYATALLSLLLALGTFYIAISLTRFRRSRYLVPFMREFLADFGPAIALGAMTITAILLHEVELKQLPAPDAFRPTLELAVDGSVVPIGSDETVATRPRAWLVNPFDAPRWVWLASLGPALLVTVLAFVDQNITARLVNNADHKLEKGEAYHFDLAVIGVLIAACSMFGLPWLVAATVRSLNHLRSLATVEEVMLPTGETRERVIHVRETRVTGFAIHLLVGLSLLLMPLLKMIPMAVLYGLFLFMGVVSMAGNQFFERLSLWLMDASLYPATHYIRRVPFWTLHTFTVVQFLCLTLLLVVEISPLAILFPLFIALLVPVRFLLGKLFKPEHLEALDADEEPEEEETQWV